jgi:ATP adenylyltransferase
MAKQSVAELIEFIRTRMRMSHIYQPVVIRSLLDSGNVATVRQLALDLLSSDEAQIRYYEDRIKKMPLPVLRRHGVISTDRDGVVRLNVNRMTFEQRAELRAACDQAIGDFLSRRGLATWDNRLLELEPVPESVRYEVLKRDGRCLLCGATPQEERLEVDHIRPRSKGGGNGADNLQTLCGRCNRGKSNRDDSDFRSTNG